MRYETQYNAFRDKFKAENRPLMKHVPAYFEWLETHLAETIALANAIIEPAQDILPETYNEEVDNWHNFVGKLG